MPPKRGKAHMVKRSDEMRRLSVGERLTAAAASTANATTRLPHHLVYRTHPRWRAPASTNGQHPPQPITGSATRGVDTGKNTAVTATKAVVNTSGCGVIPTRFVGRNCTASSREEQKESTANRLARKPASGRHNAASTTSSANSATTVGHKRHRSQSASHPIEVDTEVLAGDEGEEAERYRNTEQSNGSSVSSGGSSSSSSSVLPSQLPMVTESKVLCTGVGGGTLYVRATKEIKNGFQKDSNMSARESSASSERAETDSVSAKKSPLQNTATSTGDSNVLFGDDDDEEERKNSNGDVVWGTQGGADTEGRRSAVSGSVSLLPDGLQETHVLDELSDRAPVAPVRPQRATATNVDTGKAPDKHVGQAGRAFMVAEDEEDHDGHELLGDPFRVNEGAVAVDAATSRSAYQNTTEQNCRFQQRTDVETKNQIASTLPATPALLSTRDGVLYGAEGISLSAAAAAVNAGQFAETLAVQDLTYIPEESGVTNTQEGEISPILASSTEPYTPRAGTAVDSANVSPSAASRESNNTSYAVAPEVLLGDGLVSPPVKRATITPQQAAQGTAASSVIQGVGEDKGNATPPPPNVQRELCPPPPLLARLKDSSTTKSSLLAPHPSNEDVILFAVPADHPSPADAPPPSRYWPSTSSTAAGDSAAAPSHTSSLPSTLDDGCLKDDEQTPLRTPPWSRGTSAAQQQRGAVSNPSNDTFMKDASVSALQQQETVPIDPFLTTPPQFRQGKTQQSTDVLSDDGEVTPEHITAAVKKAKSPSPERGRRTTSKPMTPPRLNTTQQQQHEPATDIDLTLLEVGTRVEGRWGRQWFPATITEVPRNGFVQIEWAEDGSRLHVRLREVRLPVDKLPSGAAVQKASATAKKQMSAKKDDESPGARNYTGKKTPDKGGEGTVLTATQLVKLMDEEDAEESRHEMEQLHGTPRLAATSVVAKNTKAVPPTAATTRAVASESNGENAEENTDLEIKDTSEKDASRGRKRKKSSTPFIMPLSPPPSLPAEPTAPHVLQDEVATANDTEPTPQQNPVIPFETTPATLCIYLAPSVRRELLQGTCNPNSNVGSGVSAATTEVQRNTELQRILHFLTSAGASVISSLAQVDNVAAQMGDNQSTNMPFARASVACAERHASAGERSTSLPNASSISLTSSGNSGGTARRKTVGRVPLPRRSGVSPIPASTAPTATTKQYFIFLVAGPSSAGAIVDPSVNHLPDVCVAHAFGVSAIHASWLWSIVPGSLHVRLPTALEQLTLPLAATGPVGQETTRPTLPLRLMPFSSHQRWLSGKAVQFVERDDAMETWLNAAGAVVTAEPSSQPAAPATTVANATCDESKVDSCSITGGRGRSICLTHSPQQLPPRKQPCVEKQPDYVYVRETGPSVPVDLSRLGDIPVLRLPWLLRGIERNYQLRCSGAGDSATKGGEENDIGSNIEKASEELPPLLFSVWETMQNTISAAIATTARRGSPNRTEHSTTPAVREPCLKVPVTTRDAIVFNGHAEEHTTADVNAPITAAVDGNTKLFGLRSPDAPKPAMRIDETSPIRATVARVSPPPLPLPQSPPEGELATMTKPENTPNAKKKSQQNEHLHQDTEGRKEGDEAVSSLHGSEDERGLAERVTAQPYSATPPQANLSPAAVTCAHPPITIGEDYYFSVAMPSPTALCAGSMQLQPVPSTQIVIPAVTIALGRVVGLHPNTEEFAAPADSSTQFGTRSGVSSLSSAPCCFAVLQLYEPKFVCMHVEPRTGEVMRQTTVLLSHQLVTVPASSLLFDIPVYVITPEARQHVYLLEEDGGEEGLSATQYYRSGLTGAGVHQGEPDVPSPQQAQSHTVSASPDPTSPFPRRQANIPQRCTPRDDSVDDTNTALQRWSKSVADQLRTLPAENVITSLQKEVVHCSTAAIGSPFRAPDLAGLDDRSPSSAVVARHAVQGARDTPVQRRVLFGNAPRGARMLTQLPVEISGRAVVLHPGSHVSFYAHRSLSMLERRPTKAHRADSPSEFPIFSVTNTKDNATHTSHGNDTADYAGSEEDSDSSEELIAEAPLVGQVELMREIDGTVDIVVHTAQPNSVFGGSKMYRVTPDMIVDVSP